MKKSIAQLAALILIVGAATASLSVASASPKKAAPISPDAALTWNTTRSVPFVRRRRRSSRPTA